MNPDGRMERLRNRAWLWYLVASGILTAAYLLVPAVKGSGPLINILGLSSPVAIAVGMRLHRPDARWAWRLFIIGQSLFFLGDLYTYSYPKLLGVDVGFPSPGDAIYLTVYPALVGGLLLLVRRRNPDGDRAAGIDALILTVGFALLSWVILVSPNIHLSGLSWLAKSVSTAYPLGDILLLAAVIRLAVDAGKRAPAFYLLVASIVSLLIVDSAYTYALLVNGYHHQLSFDVGWIAYYVLWGAAALHPSMRTLDQPATDVRTRLTPLRLGLLAIACLIAPGIRFAEELGNPDVLVVIVASAILFLLVVSRMAGLVRQEERQAARELALRHAGVELVAAAGGDGVRGAAVHAAQSLLGTESAVRLIWLTADGAELAASSGEHSAARTSPQRRGLAEGGEPAGRKPYKVADLPRRRPGRARSRRRELGGPPAAFRSWRGPRTAARDDRAAGRERELLDSLEALASQVSLAVEGASLAEDLHRRRSEARFGSLVAHASDLITVLDADGVVTYQSPSVARILGYAVDEVEGQPFTRLLRDSDRSRLAKVIDGGSSSARHAAPETYVLDCSLRHRDGTWLQFEVQYTESRPRRACPRNRPQQPRRQRAQGLRRPARPPGVPRSGHGPRQPRTVRGPRPARCPPLASRRRRGRGHVHRSRRFQDGQRQSRPRRRRHGA